MKKIILFIAISLSFYFASPLEAQVRGGHYDAGAYILDTADCWKLKIRKFTAEKDAYFLSDIYGLKRILLDTLGYGKIYFTGFNLYFENIKTGSTIIKSGGSNLNIDNTTGLTFNSQNNINIWLGVGNRSFQFNKNTGLSGLPFLTIDTSKIEMISGSKLIMHEGTDHDTKGIAILTGSGSYAYVSIATKNITANSYVFLTRQTFSNGGGGVGALYIANVIAGTSFEIRSTDNGETSHVAWLIIDK